MIEVKKMKTFMRRWYERSYNSMTWLLEKYGITSFEQLLSAGPEEMLKVRNVLDVTVEHYRKLEAGITGISVDKVLTLYHKYGIDPTYLITGESSMKDFNLDYYVANSTKEQRNDFFDRVLAYLSKLIR